MDSANRFAKVDGGRLDWRADAAFPKGISNTTQEDNSIDLVKKNRQQGHRKIVSSLSIRDSFDVVLLTLFTRIFHLEIFYEST
jgi:hypothetical protein